jgi:hypothetical protein
MGILIFAIFFLLMKEPVLKTSSNQKEKVTEQDKEDKSDQVNVINKKVGFLINHAPTFDGNCFG